MLILCLLAWPHGQPQALDPVEYIRAHAHADAALVEGRHSEARAGFERCLQLAPRNATLAYAMACAESRSENVAESLVWLERAVEWGYADAEVALWDEDLALLRTNGRFLTALENMRGQATELKHMARIMDERAVGISDVTVDPHGQWVALGLFTGVVQLLDAHTGRSRRASSELGDKIWSLASDRAGERVAVLTEDGRLHFWPIDGSDGPPYVRAMAARRESDLPFDWPAGAFVEFDPTGERLLVAGGDLGASLLTKSGVVVRNWDEPLGEAMDLAWNPDGSRIASVCGRDVCFLDGRTGELVGAPLATPAEVASLAYSPDGKLLATGHCDRYLRVWELEGPRLLFEHFYTDIFEADMCVNAVAFSPDGRHVAGGTGEVAYVDVLAVPEGGDPVAHYDMSGGHFSEAYELRWTRDSRRLWFAFGCGGMPIEELRLEEGLPATLPTRARSPRVGLSGAAIGNGIWNAFALAAESGRCLWNRPALGRDGELIQAPTGHFAGDVADFDGLGVFVDMHAEEPIPLAKLVTQLFDPKRVRAAAAGVALAAPRF